MDFAKWPSLGVDRPNYDAWASVAWGVGLPAIFGVSMAAAHVSAEAALGLAAPGLILAPYHLKKAISWHKQRPRTIGGVEFLKLDKLSEWVQKNPDYIYLGRGFDWGREQAARAYELENAGFSGVPGKKKKKKDPNQIGLPWMQALGEPEDVAVSLKQSEGHMVIYGTTGAGKTRLLDLITSQAILRNEAVLVIDPKGDRDLRDSLKRTCEFMGTPEKFVMFHPGFPEDSIRINPLSNYTRGTELASRIAALIPSETGADPFTAFSTMVLTSIINGMNMVGEKVTLSRINSYMANGVEGLVMKVLVKYCEINMPDWEVKAREYTQQASKDNQGNKGKRGQKGQRGRTDAMAAFYREKVRLVAPSSDIDALLSYYERDHEHTQKMVTSLMPVLSSLTAGEIGPLLSPLPDSDDDREIGDLARLIERNSVIYIGLDTLPDQTVGGAIGAMILADLAAFAGDRYNYSTNNAPVNVLVDEIAEVINEPLIRVLNKARGAGVRALIAGQSYPEIVKRLGSEAGAQQAIANTNTTIALRLRDNSTKKEIAGAFPKVMIPQASRALASYVDPQMGLRQTGGRVTESWSMEEGELVSSSWLGKLPNFEFFADMAGGTIVKGKLPILD